METIIISWISKKESDFQSRVTSFLKGKWHVVFKIPDNSMNTKPYDMYYVDCNSKKTYHIELKMISHYSTNIELLRPNQHAYLKAIAKIDPDAARIWIYCKRTDEQVRIRYCDFISKCREQWTVRLFNIEK